MTRERNLKSGSVGSEGSAELLVVYDLRDPLAWRAAHNHRATWGRLYTDVVALDYDHVLLVFRPAPDSGWRPWESVRRAWILEQLAKLESEAA
jgi:hypothetical protein